MGKAEPEDTIRLLVDMEAIKNLRARYCYLVDAIVAGDKSRLDDLMALFAEDARGDYAEFGKPENKDELRQYFGEKVPGFVSFSAHMVHNPLIEIEGESARGLWYFSVAVTFREGDRAAWVQGIYEEEYVKEGGMWKWTWIKAYFDFATPYDEGWVRTRIYGGPQWHREYEKVSP